MRFAIGTRRWWLGDGHNVLEGDRFAPDTWIRIARGETHMSGHTPGPWIADSPDDNEDAAWNIHIFQANSDNRICFMSHDDTKENLRGKANARLIAAAPELLAISQEMDRLMLVIESAARTADPGNHQSVLAALKANRAAIAKAVQS